MSLVYTHLEPCWWYRVCVVWWASTRLIFTRKLEHFWRYPCAMKVILCIPSQLNLIRWSLYSVMQPVPHSWELMQPVLHSWVYPFWGVGETKPIRNYMHPCTVWSDLFLIAECIHFVGKPSQLHIARHLCTVWCSLILTAEWILFFFWVWGVGWGNGTKTVRNCMPSLYSVIQPVPHSWVYPCYMGRKKGAIASREKCENYWYCFVVLRECE